MSQTKAERLARIHDQALQDFNAVQSAQWDERMQCLADRRFYSIVGAQWEDSLGAQFENKPRFEINKVHLSVIRVINEYRNNRISVLFIPKDGTKNDKLADACAGLYRADEQDSTAEEAYDNAFEEAVGGGFGAWRLRAGYEDEDDDEDERQRVWIEPIHDADSCVFFVGAKRQDASDATGCFVLTGMSRDAYIEKYSDDLASFPKSISMSYFDWCTGDTVWIAEYYKVEERSEVIHVYRGLDDEDMLVPERELEDDPEKAETLRVTGFREVRQKRVTRKRIHKYIMSGSRILEDQGIIAGSCIPIIPMYGKRWVVDGIERMMGHVRLAKDAQRLKNMLMSYLADLVAFAQKEIPIFHPEQIAGHELLWSKLNTENYAYALINKTTDAEGTVISGGPIGYTKPPSIPPALAALLQVTEQDIQDLLGNQQAGEQMQPNISGRAVELIQQRLDMQVFIYVSNMRKAVRRSGQVWLSMAKDILIENSRRMKVIQTTGDVGSIEINRPAIDEETNEQILENDIGNAKLGVEADAGPSSVSRRAATVRALTGMMSLTQDPETLTVLSSMAMTNMEGEGIDEVRDFFRAKLVKMGALRPTDEEMAALQAQQQNQQPDPQAVYLQAAAGEADANAASKRADTVETVANAEYLRAKTEKTLAEAGKTGQDQQLAGLQALQQMLAASPNGAPSMPAATPSMPAQ